MHPQEERFYTAVVIAGIVLGFIIVHFIITMIRHQKRNVSLYKARIRAEITARENERKRIAYDLHDELGPYLSAVRLKINHFELASDEDKELLSSTNTNIDDIVNKIRDISYNLLPNTLVRNGLAAAVKEYINKLSEIHKLHIVLEMDEGNWNLPKEKEINIYRIIQEIVHNTMKHAGAKQLIIQLKRKDDDLLLATTDDGKGFDFDRQSSTNTGLGMYNLQSRAEMLNAELSIQSSHNNGTKFLFEIPLK